MDVICDYCQTTAALVGGDVIYSHRPDLYQKKFWLCAPCDAYVGTHKNSPTHEPLGRLANKELRMWKGNAHTVFDPMWLEKKMKRTEAYVWLADALGIHPKDCHIGMFDVAMCKRVIEVVKNERNNNNN